MRLAEWLAQNRSCSKLREHRAEWEASRGRERQEHPGPQMEAQRGGRASVRGKVAVPG